MVLQLSGLLFKNRGILLGCLSRRSLLPLTASHLFLSQSQVFSFSNILVNLNCFFLFYLIKGGLTGSFLRLIDLFNTENLQRHSSRLGFSIYLLCHFDCQSRFNIIIKNDIFLRGILSLVFFSSCIGWLERECWDLFGVVFFFHQNLRRLLSDYGFRGHVLRKDFPVSGFLEERFSEEHEIVCYDFLLLSQNFRVFTKNTPWNNFIL